MRGDDRRNKWRDKQGGDYFEEQRKRSSDYVKTPFGFLTWRAGSVNAGVKARGKKVGPNNRLSGGDLLNLISIQGGNPLECNCAICFSRLSGWVVDHIIPVSEGGGNTKENIQLLCEECHKKKTLSERRGRAELKRQSRRIVKPLSWDEA